MFMTKTLNIQSKPITAGLDFSKMLPPIAAAVKIDCSTRTLHRLRLEGKIPAYKVRGKVRFRPEDIDAMIAASRVN
jgi:excisionase family DNA binding protein